MLDDFPCEPNEYDYFTNKRSDRTYISKAFELLISYDPPQYRRARYISKVFDSEENHQFANIKGEIVLRVTPQQRQEIKVLFYEDPRDVVCLTIQKYTRETGEPHKIHFTFRGDEIDKLYNLIRLIKYLRLESTGKEKLDDHILEDLLIDEAERRQYFLNNMDLVQEIVENNLTRSDVVALAYRKKQLEIFEKLLQNENYFEATRQKWGKRGKEAVWQQFFEDNPWIFGYGLNYLFTSRLDNRKLEQVTTGYAIDQSGKRVDALLKTRGFISSLCFVEIKTHKSPLLEEKPYRSESWGVSSELTGSIAQIQKTVQKAILQIQTQLNLYDSDGTPTGETAFLYQPKSVVVIGSLQEFISSFGVNEQKFGSFELFRRNVVNPEIITFDELFERAKFIVKHSENEKPFVEKSNDKLFPEDEISF